MLADLLAWAETLTGWQVIAGMAITGAVVFGGLELAARAGARRRGGARHALRSHPHAWRPTTGTLEPRRRHRHRV